MSKADTCIMYENTESFVDMIINHACDSDMFIEEDFHLSIDFFIQFLEDADIQAIIAEYGFEKALENFDGMLLRQLSACAIRLSLKIGVYHSRI